MGAEQSDGLNRIKASVVHPMVRLAHEREVVGIVIAAILVQMRYSETSKDL
jgi:hypothetical protein